MMKEEFIREVKKLNGDIEPNITPVDYTIIETVYTYHPSINEVTGKYQIAYLYFHFGMRVIKDMLETANKCRCLEDKIAQARNNLEELQLEYAKLIR